MTARDRKTFIGSSDAKRILDGDWYGLWLEKTGREPRENLDDKFNVQLGTYTEPFHLDWTIRRMIEAGEIVAETREMRQHECWANDHACAHIDTLVALPEGAARRHAVVEAKHSSGKRSLEDLLDSYMPQVQHQLWCMDAHLAVLSVIQGNEEPVRQWIGRSDDWIGVYAEACARFWRYVATGKAPPRQSPGEDVLIPQVVKDAVPVNGRVRRCMDQSNRFLALAGEYAEGARAAKAFEDTKKALKALIRPEDAELYCRVLTMKRDARGAIRFTVHEQKETVA